MIQLQKNDSEARKIVHKLHKEKVNTKMFILHEGVLCRLWVEERETFRCIFIPEVLRDPLLILAHNQNSHNGGRCTYMALKKMYYWPGMRSKVFKHFKNCQECMLQNQANTAADFKHFKMPDIPMQLICMDLVGPISPVTSRGNHFILTCIDMLTGFTIAIPIKDKSASTVCDAYRAHIYCTFGGSARILTDNGTEFKNEQMDELCKQLDIKRICSLVYTPEANGRLEVWQPFLQGMCGKIHQGKCSRMGRSGSAGCGCIQCFPLPGRRRITIRTHARQRSDHPICKTIGASRKVLGRPWRSSENGFIKEAIFVDSRERDMSKRKVGSHQNKTGERVQSE